MKNILLLILDCVRAEKTIIDYPLATRQTRKSAQTPFLDKIRKLGTTWSNFFAVSSTTTPNFATIFTGLLPVEHGIFEHSRYSLRPDCLTLAEWLQSAGYHTYAEMTGPLIPETGLNRGFEHYRYRPRSRYLHHGFAADVQGLWQNIQSPWFLCLHLWEAHTPYQRPEPFNQLKYGVTEYDRAISLIDFHLAELLAKIDLDSTILVYTSDHGERLAADYELNRFLGGSDYLISEAFGEFVKQRQDKPDYAAWFAEAKGKFGEESARIYAHNVLGHGFHLTDELLHVPLVIVDREHCRPGICNDRLHGQSDLFATILDLANIAHTGNLMERSLLRDFADEMIYVEANGSGGRQYASRCYLRGARSLSWKYWRVEADSLDQRVLWNLNTDPREISNCLKEYPEIAAEMDAFVSTSLKKKYVQAETDRNQENEETIRTALKSLGYL